MRLVALAVSLAFAASIAACGDSNAPPDVAPRTAATPEDTPVSITVSAEDPEGAALTFTYSDPEHGTLTGEGATVTYLPDDDYHGPDSIIVTVDDGEHDASAPIALDITPVNDDPVAGDDTLATDEGTAATVNVATLLTDDDDVDGDTLSITALGVPSSGDAGLDAAVVTYTPAPDFVGTATFEYTLSDGNGGTDAGLITVSIVTAVNDPPVAGDDSDTIDRDTPKTQPFSFYLADDTDGGDGGALTITAVSDAVNGEVAITGGTNITFTPPPGFVGAASFDYTLSDGVDPDTGHVTLDVVETNIPVVAVDDADTVAEDAVLTRQTSFYTANDSDPDPQTLVITAVSGPVNGTVGLAGTTITFTADAGYNGPAQFDYIVTDGVANDTGRVNVTVTAVNDPPDAVDDVATVAEDGSVGILPLVNDTNDDGPLIISAFTQGANGTVTQTLNTLTYAPAANFGGTNTFTYTVEDLGGLTDTATVTVTVTPVADTPVAMGQAVTTDEGVPVTITLTATDPDQPPVSLVFAIVDAPDNGSLGTITQTSATSATVVYTPNPFYFGPDSFTFTAGDGGSTSAPATISITVNNVIVCNDGRRELPETCDDGNILPDDGCDASCATEQGWDCGTAQPSVCATVCGDNFVVVGREECDDTNGIETDGCTTQCQSGPVCALAVPALAEGDRFTTDPGNGNCYVSFDHEQTTFASAQAACITAGGHLASITSSGEQGLVASVHNLTQEPWIGLADEIVEGSFGWVTGEPLTFNNFGPLQPDGGAPEDCVNLTTSTSTWNDTSCTFIGFTDGRICELDANSCGDGIVHTARGEVCDDRNTNNSDGCSSTCQVEAGAVCTGLAPTTCAKLVLNEIEYDNQGSDNTNGQFEFVEVLSTGTAPADVNNIALLLMNAGTATPSEYFSDGTTGMVDVAKRIRLNTATGLVGNLLPPGEMIVVGAAGLVDPLPGSVHKITVLPPAAGWIQNGSPDALALFNISGAGSVVDAVSWKGSTAPGAVLTFAGTFALTEGTGMTPADTAPAAGNFASIQRVPNGRDTQNNNADFLVRPVTPGLPNPAN